MVIETPSEIWASAHDGGVIAAAASISASIGRKQRILASLLAHLVLDGRLKGSHREITAHQSWRILVAEFF